MTTPAQIADAVENARVKIAAGTGDYLDEVVDKLADDLETEQIECMVARRLLNQTRADLQEALALLRERNHTFCPVIDRPDGLKVDECSWEPPGCWVHRKRAFLAQHPTANEQPKSEDAASIEDGSDEADELDYQEDDAR